MSTEANKQFVRDAYAAVSEGDHDGFMERLADDVEWTFYGNHRFARTFHGKADLMENLFGVLGAQLESGITLDIQNVIGDGDMVVVEALGKSRTKDGRDYNNTYCLVLTLREGKIAQIREYLDTELVSRIFG